MVAWHWCTGSWCWHGIGALDPDGDVGVLDLGTWWWRGTGALDLGGGVALVHWIILVAWHWCTGSMWWREAGSRWSDTEIANVALVPV